MHQVADARTAKRVADEASVVEASAAARLVTGIEREERARSAQFEASERLVAELAQVQEHADFLRGSVAALPTKITKVCPSALSCLYTGALC